MTPEFVVTFAQEAIKTTILVSMPMLGLGLAVGLIVSIFQAVTQINEMTLTFVPKILIVLLALLFFANWMIEHLMVFTTNTTVLYKVMEGFQIQYQEFKPFFLILIRVGVILFMFPFFNSKVIPVLSKAGLVLILSIILFPVIDTKGLEFPNSLYGIFQMIASELIIGMILGILIQLLFEGIRMMGQVVGFQTGFAITNILDPQSGMQVSILSNMAYLSAIVLFLILNGHYILLNAIRDSFQIINVGSLSLDNRIFESILRASGGIFVIAIKIGAPAIAVLLFVQVSFGLITKLIPQMNIMIVAFPVQIVMGLIFFGICLNMLSALIERYLGNLGSLLINTMCLLKA
jgi:flagellar biosynthetic protein FliR